MNVQQKIALGYLRTKISLLAMINKKKAGEEAFRLFCTPYVKYSGKESEVFKAGEALQFMLDGKKIKGYRCNHPQQHKVLLLHGFSSSCHNFQSYVPGLIHKNYEVLAFDAPAHGASEGETINAVEYADMIKKIVELYGPIKGFLAHSFGGLAICLALEQIPHAADTKVVLIAPATETSTAIDKAMVLLGVKNPVLRRSLDELIFKLKGKETSWYSIRRAIKNIKASVLWIHDEDDDITPMKDAVKVQDDAPGNVKFHFTKTLGHRRIYRDSQVMNEVINFL